MSQSKYGAIRWISEGHGSDKQCQIDAQAKYIDPNGNVVVVPLATGSGIPRTQNLYRPFIEGVKEKKGWRRWDSFASDEERDAYIRSKRGPYEERQLASRRAYDTREERAIQSAQDSTEAVRELSKTMREYIEGGGEVKEQGGARKSK